MRPRQLHPRFLDYHGRREHNVLILGFSGIHNGEYYLQRYGLRFVGHDAAVALVCDGQILFAAEEERFSRQKHTSSFPTGALDAALRLLLPRISSHTEKLLLRAHF